jgi:hypothetical protein
MKITSKRTDVTVTTTRTITVDLTDADVTAAVVAEARRRAGLSGAPVGDTVPARCEIDAGSDIVRGAVVVFAVEGTHEARHDVFGYITQLLPGLDGKAREVLVSMLAELKGGRVINGMPVVPEASAPIVAASQSLRDAIARAVEVAKATGGSCVEVHPADLARYDAEMREP